MSRRLLVSVFGNEHDLLGATKAAREKGYEIVDVYTPYAVHGLDTAMGVRPTRLAYVCFALGLSGAVAKLGFQIWTSAWNWPVNVGGKPLISIPAFVPVTFEVMVLFAGVGTVLAFFLRSKLFPGKKPSVVYDRVTDDRFVLVLAETDAAFDVRKVREMFKPFGLLHLEERLEKEE
ncbi:MAG: DUF3341 domain-containing protein [candidate division KSB1 bacterium]|nr:DUF3341 domain-containing protein [candidate division KSB1 bacterium]MDZ7300705.1 DUF3341 domain-containing protein [candidate division KSB1 bacterium]MDZ7310025.1 DUF3341 domain-containing protein [candidate division KSB1 bacterium]